MLIKLKYLLSSEFKIKDLNATRNIEIIFKGDSQCILVKFSNSTYDIDFNIR